MDIKPCSAFNQFNNRNYIIDSKAKTHATNAAPPKVQKSCDKKTIICSAAAAAAIAAGIACYIISRGRKAPNIKANPHSTQSEQLSSRIQPTAEPQISTFNGNSTLNKTEPVIRETAPLDIFKEQLALFPKDIEYRKLLLSGLSESITDPAILRPIIGPEEFKSIVESFSGSSKFYRPGKNLITEAKDGYDLSNAQSGKFRANLHMHTVYSDGKLTIQELLDKSAEYANKAAAELTPGSTASNAPFTIAITDHDTVDGCREAVKIISEAPLKYQNLRVVLGCELTVENRMIPQKLKTPIPIHMLLHGINPFDKELCAFLEKTKTARVELVNKLISKAVETLKTDYPKTAEKLSYSDAENLYPVFKNKILHVDYSTKDYLQFRTIFSECVEENAEIQNLLKDKGIKIDYTTPKDRFFDKIPDNFGEEYWKKYLLALQKCTAEALNIPESEAAQKITVSEKLANKLSELAKITEEAKPQLKLSPAFNDMGEAIELIKRQPQGFVSIAHPGLTGIGDCLENPAESMQGMKDLFRTFKEKGGERALGTEIYYHYFGGVGKSTDWLNSIKSYVKEFGLLYGGGLDTHGKNIFYSGR